MSEQLEQLYQHARSALKTRDYARASELLRQILQLDENYKDASRLLAQSVRLRRRRWYNHPVLWIVPGAAIVLGLGVWLAPRISIPTASVSTSTPQPTISRVPTTPTITFISTETPTLAPTPIPLVWKRVSIGDEFERDTVTALVIDPKDPDVLYAGMKNAGIFKSIDGGLSWQPAHQGLANAHVTSLLIDFQETQIVYAGTMGGIYKTEDGGGHWLSIGKGTHVLMDPQDNSHLYIRDNDNIYESSDHGMNWEPVYSSQAGCPGKIYSWAIHPTDAKTLFVIGGETCGWSVYQSNDRGNSWVLIPKYVFDIPSGANIFDWGVDKLSVGLDGQGNIDISMGELAAYDSDGFRYFYWDARLYKQKPKENRWIPLGNPDVGTGIGVVATITISPFDQRTIYAGGEGLSISRDGGLTWTKLNNGIGNTSLQLETVFGETDSLYLISGECRESRPYKGEENYNDREFTQSLYGSTSGGQNWKIISQIGCYLAKDADGSTLYRLGKNHYVHESWQGGLWRSRDGGQTWEALLTPWGNTRVTTLTTDPFQSGVVHLYNQRWDGEGIHDIEYISVNHGYSWKRVEPLVGLKPCYGSTLQFIDAHRPMAIDPLDGNHVFVIDNGTLLESHDSCDTTSAFTTPPDTSLNSIAFDPKNSHTLYTGTDQGAYISFDSGITWEQINDGLLGATVVYSIVVDNDSNVYASTPYGIFKLEGK